MKPFQIVFAYARQYTVALIVTVLSMLLLVGVQLLIPWIIKLLIADITEQASAQASLSLITQLTLVVLIVYVARAGLQFLRSYMAHVAGWGVVADVRKHIYEHLQRLSLRFYEDKQTGQLMSRVVNDSDLFEQLISHAVPDVVVNVLTLVGVSAVLFSLNWRLTLLSLVPIPLVVVSLRVYARYVRPGFPRAPERAGRPQRHAQRQPLRHPRDQGLYPRAETSCTASASRSTTTGARCCRRCG